MGVKTRLTAEEFFKNYPEETRLELIGGEVYQMPAPSFLHQHIIGNLYFLIRQLLSKEPRGVVIISPIDVVLSEEEVLQPDLLYISDLSKVKDKVYGAPDLVVEVVSASTLKRDLVDKMRVYQTHGVKEYWLVFPAEKSVIVYTLTERGYEVFSYATEEGKVSSWVLEGLEIELRKVFEGLQWK